MGNKSFKQRLFSRYRGNRLLFDILYHTGKDLAPSKWVFIIGCYNSGTTLLDQILAQHEEIGGLNDEGVMLTNKLPRPEDFGWRRMWARCENKMSIKGSVEISREIKRHWSHFYDSRKPVFVEKSISNTPRALFFSDYFKPAYFIHIVRNGYAVIEGIRRKAAVMPGNPFFQAGRYPIDVCAEQWMRSLQVVDEQRSSLENYLEISYERLTAQPDNTMREVCSFLGIIPMTNSLSEVSFQVHQNNQSIRNMNESSLKNLSEEDICAINRVAESYLNKYNYLITTSGS